jgi:acylphosphatase
VRRARVRVSGRVQGVYFRAETRTRARALGLAGWVHNARDGSVEAVFEGETERIELMIGWCSRGPSGAEVASVDVVWEEPVGERDFRVVG